MQKTIQSHTHTSPLRRTSCCLKERVDRSKMRTRSLSVQEHFLAHSGPRTELQNSWCHGPLTQVSKTLATTLWLILFLFTTDTSMRDPKQKGCIFEPKFLGLRCPLGRNFFYTPFWTFRLAVGINESPGHEHGERLICLCQCQNATVDSPHQRINNKIGMTKYAT